MEAACGTAQRQERHLAIESSIKALFGALDRLQALRSRIVEGGREIGPETPIPPLEAAKKEQSPSLQAVLIEAPERIREAGKAIDEEIFRIQEALF